jgi:pimeloyl-ACP methyl ester carboxylesterase
MDFPRHRGDAGLEVRLCRVRPNQARKERPRSLFPGLFATFEGPFWGPIRAFLSFRSADNLKAMETKLAMPVLAIGAEKAFGANVAVVMRNAATNVQELVVPNAGHWLMEEAPAATIAAVQDFLAAH